MTTDTKTLKLELTLAAVALLALTGCPPAYPKCDNDEQCKEKGEVCVQGQCQECATNANCKAGFVCDANKCVPKPECTSDGACGAGKKCSQGKCIVAEAPREEGTCVRNDDCPSGEECKEGRCAAKSVSACDFSPIRFDFNASDLSPEAQGRLQKIADCIKKQSLRFTLEGHADDRGTEEYNLQLSNRRAASAKRYLATLGVGEAALVTVGFGENKPAVNGQNEEAWAANRRVELKPR